MIPAPGRTALVVGAGRTGLALARFLHGRQVEVRLCDLRTGDQLDRTRAQFPPGTQFHFGGYSADILDGVAAVFTSPGVPPWDPLLTAARMRGLQVGGEMSLFMELCPAPVVAITGTKGKSTTTALCGSILSKGARPVMVGGNIGETLLDRLDQIGPDHWVVVELSSYQIAGIDRPRPHVAVVLNVGTDHIDWHGSLAAYREAKAKLVLHQDQHHHAVLNLDDGFCRSLAQRTAAGVSWFSPNGHGSARWRASRGHLWLGDRRLMPVAEVPLRGRHNLGNVLAAAAVADLVGIPEELIREAVLQFRGLAHRLQSLGVHDAIEYVNDSKATTPAASMAAIRSFPGRQVVLIAGGQVHGPVAQWIRLIGAAVDWVVLLGESAERLAGELRSRGLDDFSLAADLEQAVAQASQRAAPGGVVLFSPGGKSFDMFRDFEDRGDRFRWLVGEVDHG